MRANLSHIAKSGCFLVALLAVPLCVEAAETASGTLTVTGTVSSSITLTVESAAGTFSNAGGAATTTLGSVSKYGTAPTGFSITPGTTTWTLGSTSGVAVNVIKANLASSTYVLTAKLHDSPSSGIIWRLNSLALNGAANTVLTLVGTYSATAVYPWSIEIPDSLAKATTIDNVIHFTATSN